MSDKEQIKGWVNLLYKDAKYTQLLGSKRKTDAQWLVNLVCGLDEILIVSQL